MTRRKFIQGLVKAGAGVVLGIAWLCKKALPRKFVRACKVKKYPGHLRALGDISEKSKWSG
jgi:hypothetical protein